MPRPCPPCPTSKRSRSRRNARSPRCRLDERFLAALDEELAGLPASMAFIAERIRPSARDRQERALHRGSRHRDRSRCCATATGSCASRRRSSRATAPAARGRSARTAAAPVCTSSIRWRARSIVLNEQSRTATRIPRMPSTPEPPVPPVPPVPPHAAGAARAAGRAMAGTREVEVQPGRVIVQAPRRRRRRREDVQVEVIRIARGEHDARHAARATAAAADAADRAARQGRDQVARHRASSTASRPTGTMTSHTIPPAQIGNEQPIVITSERWFSPELHIVVYAKTSDPRAGETIYRVTNVKRGEPSADLFKVPADYRMRGEGRAPRRDGRESCGGKIAGRDRADLDAPRRAHRRGPAADAMHALRLRRLRALCRRPRGRHRRHQPLPAGRRRRRRRARGADRPRRQAARPACGSPRRSSSR